jgi:cardiolipin synthase
MASQHVYNVFLRKGVRIYEHWGKALHCKTITIDGIYSAIGSFNLDPLSHFWNLELNLTTLDTETATQLEEHFLSDSSQSTEVTLANLHKRTIFQRMLHWSCYHLLRFFG